LKAELLKAEEEARARKRKTAGLPQDSPMTEVEDRNPEDIKRRKLLQTIALDKDDEDEAEADQLAGDDTKMSPKGDR